MENCFYRTSIKALITNDEGKFLLVKEDNGKRELPGGGLDFGEEPHIALKRELQEEMGLETTDIEANPSYFLTAISPRGIWIANILYKTKVKDLNFTPSSECVELRFFNIQEAEKEELFPNVKEFIKIYK